MNTGSQPSEAAPRGLILAAFAAIYVIWGSTYLGIRFAVETIPPFFMAGVRFALAGVILYGWTRGCGAPKPVARDWRNAALIGTLLIGIGNGGVCWAEQRVPSGLAALLVGMMPIWLALLEGVRPGGTRPTWQTWLGVAAGFGGVAWLAFARHGVSQEAIDPLGAVILALSSFSWASGTLVARHSAKPATPLLGVSLQMIAGGTALILFSGLTGEAATFAWSRVSARSLWAFGYLLVFGSLVAFSAYIWLLRASTPARVATCAYVNPAIAVCLGWALGGEQLTPAMLWAGAIIVLGVVIIITQPLASAKGRAQVAVAITPAKVCVAARNGGSAP